MILVLKPSSYYSLFQDLVKYLNSIDEEACPGTLVVADLEKLVDKCFDPEQKISPDRQFSLNFAKISAILNDFCQYFATKLGKPTSLMVFSKMTRKREELLGDRLRLWFSETWEVSENKIICKSSSKPQTIHFFLNNNSYFLDKLEHLS